MFWIIPAWVASVIAAYLLGRYLRDMTKRIVELEKAITMKIDKDPEPEQPKSTLVDVTDPVQEAIFEHERLMKELNSGK